jgi:hypothetical protein
MERKVKRKEEEFLRMGEKTENIQDKWESLRFSVEVNVRVERGC